MSNIFHLILIQPLFNTLVFLYNTVAFRDMGLAIILLTLLVKLILYPLSQQSLKAQKSLQDLQPKINEVREKYKDNKEKQSQELMKLYSQGKVNPLSSCFPLLIQFPLLIALYRVFVSGLHTDALKDLYPFVANPGQLTALFLGFIDMAKPNIVFAFIAGIFQFIQTRMFQAKQKKAKKEEKAVVDLDKNGKVTKKPADNFDMTSAVNNQLTYMMPIVTIVFALRLPAALSLYWSVSTLFAIAQQWYIMKKTKA